MRIGVPQSGYGAARNIPEMPGVQHVRPWDIYRVVAGTQHLLGGRPSTELLFSFRDPHFPQVDLLHFFNTVARTATPWVTTYESLIPRWYDRTSTADRARGVDLMLGDSCRQLIGFSGAAAAIFCDHIDRLGRSADWPAIEAKNTVLHPPQPLFPVVTRPDGPVRFAFVGGDFYRKGGLECLEALHRLHAAGIRDWRFEIIGQVDRWHDTTANTSEADGQRAAALLAAMPEHVTHRSAAPYADVLALLGRSHYLLFPTFQDTYGYVVLEAMASGCVPVATAVRSLPEVIEQGANGLLIEVPVNSYGDAHRTATTPEEKVRLVDRLEEALQSLLKGGHALWPERSEAAREHIRTRHNPAQHAAVLMEIYLSIAKG